MDMDTKLTLKLEQGIIEKAKDYARVRKTSLSNLIENYLRKLTDEQQDTGEGTALVKSLTGIITLPENTDMRNAYGDYLSKKYS